MSDGPPALRPPSLMLSIFEGPRAMAEASMLIPTHQILRGMPKGDGHPVMVLPGFLASDVSTMILRRYLKRWNYDAHGWKLGRNLGLRPERRVEERLEQRMEELAEGAGAKITLIGWSLGGLLAREMARQRPDLVRGIVTLGSPLGDPRATNVWRLYEYVSGTRLTDPGLAERIAHIRRPLPGIPATAVYSKSDSIVSWQIAMEPEGEHAESVSVLGSHFGLGMNPLALYVIADRLHHLSNGGWRPFRIDALRRLFYN